MERKRLGGDPQICISKYFAGDADARQVITLQESLL